MANDKRGRARNERHSADTISQLFRVPPLRPQRIAMWFAVLQAQLEAARITSDKTKFTALVANLGDQYLHQVEDIVLGSAGDGTILEAQK